MTRLTKPVGRGVANTNQQEVKAVQVLLNRHRLSNASPVQESGVIDQRTIAAIEEFQRRVVKMSKPDGRIDPQGATWRALTSGPASSAVATTAAATAKGGSVTVVYKSSLSAAEQIVDPYCFDVIKMVMRNAGCSTGVITSTIRTPAEQVDIMYRNAKANLANQYKLYGANGDAVLKVFEDNQKKSEVEVKKLMVEKVESLLKQGKRVSLHVTTPEQYKKKNIIDIGVNSTQAAAGTTFNKAKITAAFNKAAQDGYIQTFIDETGKSNNCWHIEVVPNSKVLPKAS